MAAISRPMLVDAALNLNSKEGLDLDPPIDVSKGIGELRAQIANAGALLSAEHGDLDKINDPSRFAHNTLVVLDDLRQQIVQIAPSVREVDINNYGGVVLDDLDEVLDAIALRVESAWEGEDVTLAAEQEPPPSAPQKEEAPQTEEKVLSRKAPDRRVPVLGRFRPVRRVGHFAAILREYQARRAAGARVTVEDVSDAVGISVEKTVAALKKARRKNGIDYQIAVDDSLSIILPEGVNVSSVWHDSIKVGKLRKKAVAPKVRTQRDKSDTRPRKLGRVQAMFEAARRGEAPAHFVITSPTNRNNQKHLDRLREFADAGDWNSVRSYAVNGSNSYADMIRSYRDLLIIAHEARLGKEVAAA